MNILHVHQRFWPHQGGSTFRLLRLIKEDFENRHYVLCKLEQRIKGLEEDKVDKIEIIRYKHYYQIPILILFIVKQKNIQIIHTHNQRPLFYTFLVNIFLRIPLVHEMHSMYLPKNNLKRIISVGLIKTTKSIVVLSNEMKKELKRFFKGNIYVIYNRVDTNFTGEKFRKFIIPQKNRINIGYFGSLDFFQGLENVISLSKLCESIQRIKFYIVGGTTKELSNLLKISNIDQLPLNIKYFEEMDNKYIQGILEQMDYTLTLKPKTTINNSALPLKPLESISCGVPVITFHLEIWKELEKLLGSEFKNYLIECDNIDIVKKGLIERGKKSKKKELDLDLILKTKSDLDYSILYSKINGR